MNNKIAMIALGALLVGGVAVTVMKTSPSNGGAAPGHMMTPTEATLKPAEVILPAFTLTERRGEAAFNANCAQCHGNKATGTDQGPPFLHSIYKSNHHGDEAFFRAAQNGAVSHHWPYGNMPPQPQVGTGDLKAIVAYVRALQNANGYAN